MIDTVMLIDGWRFVAFLGAVIILFITPGPNMMFVVASGLKGGARAGGAAGLGAATGSLFHIALAAAGVSTLLIAVPAAYDAVRYVGAAYLIWLAVDAWRAGDDLEDRLGRSEVWRAFRRGLITSVLNPKLALFMLAFLPQFADPAIGPVWRQIVVFGVITAFFSLLFDGGFGVFAGFVADRLRRASGVMNKVSALVFGALALMVIAEDGQ